MFGREWDAGAWEGRTGSNFFFWELGGFLEEGYSSRVLNVFERIKGGSGYFR